MVPERRCPQRYRRWCQAWSRTAHRRQVRRSAEAEATRYGSAPFLPVEAPARSARPGHQRSGEHPRNTNRWQCERPIIGPVSALDNGPAGFSPPGSTVHHRPGDSPCPPPPMSGHDAYKTGSPAIRPGFLTRSIDQWITWSWRVSTQPSPRKIKAYWPLCRSFTSMRCVAPLEAKRS